MRIREILSEDVDLKTTLSSLKNKMTDKIADLFATDSPGEKSATLSVPSGDRNKEVADVQKALLALGSTTSKDLGNLGLKKDGVDGIRGWRTEKALKKFQSENSLPTTGKADPATIEALNSALTAGDIKITKSTDTDVVRNTMGSRGPSAEDLAAIQSPEFNDKLNKIGQKLGVDPKDLMRIMQFETAGTMSPSKQSGTSDAVGLIQFMPDTARDLGTTTEKLAKMSAVEQLDYVYRFYDINGVKPGMGVGDLYMLTFMPRYVHEKDDTVLGREGGGKLPGTNLSMDAIWRQNPGFSNGGPKGKPGGKSYFTVGDVRRTIERRA
jgi:peptidoglycan hydrolase-like protein with peptidoglycan-binding domain